MIPLKDINPSRSTPWVTYLILAANLAMFVYQVNLRAGGGERVYGEFIFGMGLIPEHLLHPTLWASLPLAPPLTLLTSMFVHASLFHLVGNMLYLWVFADNVEDAMGPARFALFYLLCGLAAAGAQVAMAPDSQIPMVGASGAIAGVLGAYLILYPAAQVLTLVFLLIFVRIMYLPAVLLLGFWFLIQLMSAAGPSGAGIAWYAHIGGFLAGVLLIRFFAVRVKRRLVAIDPYHL